MKRMIEVAGKLCEVQITQQAPAVWLAIGEFDEKTIEGKGKSPDEALDSWREAALAAQSDPD